MQARKLYGNLPASYVSSYISVCLHCVNSKMKMATKCAIHLSAISTHSRTDSRLIKQTGEHISCLIHSDIPTYVV